MNEKNLEYLKDSLKYLGFGEVLYPKMEDSIRQQFPEFVLKLNNQNGKEGLETDLHFRKAATSEMYFFNKYDATLTRDDKSQVSQTFYINRGSTITLKEAYNLLNGRAVHKELTNNEGQSYNAWVQLDFHAKDERGNHMMKQYHENYGFDLEKTLNKYPIRELNEEGQREVFIRSLQRGNLQAVTFSNEKGNEKFFIEANPQFKTMNVYDGSMELLSREALKALEVNDSLAKSNKDDVSKSNSSYKEINDENKNGLKEGEKNKVKKNSLPDEPGLLPKKRTSNKKGLSI